ncbi:L-2,4-diaminobutyric acid acetyltransferase [Oxalobacteraceae bacterium IMCC9480]|nr:L-2,4-diaminobutyric acid acetyltransferase [Oxalobacteraceae bacterium IMCC9480]NDP58853.1 diaminobutyrate acetyltransferase [Oxalobacteraceae bacterium]
MNEKITEQEQDKKQYKKQEKPLAAIRLVRKNDGAALHDLIAACPPLDLNSRYAYLLLCHHHAQTSVVAEQDGVIVGAVTAYLPPDQPDTLFVWQVAVAPENRGQRLGKRMLEHLLQAVRLRHLTRWIETTISPDNAPSHQLFTSFASQHDAGCAITTLFAAGDFGESGHEEERLYKIGPLDRKD